MQKLQEKNETSDSENSEIDDNGKKVFKDFIAGDQVVGVSCQLFGRRGVVDERVYERNATKVFVKWAEGNVQPVLKGSLLRKRKFEKLYPQNLSNEGTDGGPEDAPEASMSIGQGNDDSESSGESDSEEEDDEEEAEDENAVNAGRRSKRIRVDQDGMYLTATQVIPTQRPKLLEVGMKHFGAVDLHDRYRQGFLGLENWWATHKCWVRLFTTLYGIILTDAFLAYKYEKESNAMQLNETEEESKVNYTKFLGRLAHQLIHCTAFDPVNIASSVKKLSTPTQDKNPIKVPFLLKLNQCPHIIEKIRKSHGPNKERIDNALIHYQRVCKVCTSKASTFCSLCSNPDKDSYYTCCSGRTNRDCWILHSEYHSQQNS